MSQENMIPFLNMGRVFSRRREGLDAAWKRVLDSGWYVLGPEVREFEKEFAAAIRAPWCVGVANGTDAIELGLRALGVEPGREVITTPLTAMPTLMGIIAGGAKVRLADVSRDTGLIDPDSVRAAISPETAALVPVHLYGRMCDMKTLMEIAQEKNLKVLEDCAQSHLAVRDGVFAGASGHLASWSFYPTKNLGAVGDAGAVSGRSEELADAIRALRNYGQNGTYNHERIGRNSRLDELQAALLRELLKELAADTEHRRDIAELYYRELGDKLKIIGEADRVRESSYHLFVIIAPYERDRFREDLKNKGVGSLVHYPIPAHLQGAFADLGYAKGALPNSEYLSENVVSLPLNAALTMEEAERVVAAVRSLV